MRIFGIVLFAVGLRFLLFTSTAFLLTPYGGIDRVMLPLSSRIAITLLLAGIAALQLAR